MTIIIIISSVLIIASSVLVIMASKKTTKQAVESMKLSLESMERNLQRGINSRKKLIHKKNKLYSNPSIYDASIMEWDNIIIDANKSIEEVKALIKKYDKTFRYVPTTTEGNEKDKNERCNI